MSLRYSETRRVLFWNPVVMDSPSGEVTVTFGRWLSRLPLVRVRWTLNVRGMYATGCGKESLVRAMSDFSGRLAAAGAGSGAVELGRLAEAWSEGE